jgi:hypothetical protein
MPAGDRQRTWFPEMVEALRTEWRAEMSWDELIALRGRLDRMLQDIRESRHIQPATASMLCPCCGAPVTQGSANVSVRATILALSRFGIAPEDYVKVLEKRWNKYRQANGCDLHGKQRP